ncbi:spore germination protein [Paenibacillus sp. MWE-103]|uniref:Spore germination protein n=1 Tax=Paenibacillus artemisiicola TaxID=1172618 RepID=A0ABS3W4T5_9BACL|nr:spore germination protein [Paenibacillus artemisiicola]MBO7743186.1 spore germination protein [Paenibacillus artemisiicola]
MKFKKHSSGTPTEAALRALHQNTDCNNPMSSSISNNEQQLRSIFHDCSDVVFHNAPIPMQVETLAIYIIGLSDTKHLDELMLNQLIASHSQEPLRSDRLDGVESVFQKRLVPVSMSRKVTSISEVVDSVLKGEVVFLFEGESQGLAVCVPGTEGRAVEDPPSEPVIRGPREGFVERLATNTSLLRRRLRSAHLKIETFSIGTLSHTEIALVYVKSIVKEELLHDVRNRLQRIQIDGVLESGYIEEFITDTPYSPFPQVQNTERPDVVIGSILEGKVAVLTEGTPIALVLPMTFWTGLQASEDYYERSIIATPIRWLRILFMSVSLLLPSLYVSLVSYDHPALPTNLLLSIASSQRLSPFPAIIETFLMEITFEALREAGVRLPKGVGSAVTIVGGIVIGQAAVQAGFISAPVVIVVATTGIASFIIPRYNFGLAFRLLRFPLLLLAGFMGFFGLMIGILAIIVHLAALRSFGLPYLYPVAPLSPEGLKDVFIRKTWFNMGSRPRPAAPQNHFRIPPAEEPDSRIQDE